MDLDDGHPLNGDVDDDDEEEYESDDDDDDDDDAQESLDLLRRHGENSGKASRDTLPSPATAVGAWDSGWTNPQVDVPGRSQGPTFSTPSGSSKSRLVFGEGGAVPFAAGSSVARGPRETSLTTIDTRMNSEGKFEKVRLKRSV